MIKNHKDFWSGLMFMAFGLGVIAIARHYPFGTTIRMGAGFFPMVLASLLAVFGLADHLDLRMLAQQHAQALARQWLVIGDQDPHLRGRHGHPPR